MVAAGGGRKSVGATRTPPWKHSEVERSTGQTSGSQRPAATPAAVDTVVGE